MKKFIKFALFICLLAIGIAAVLCVRYPQFQPMFAEFGREVSTRIGEFFKRVAEALWQAIFG